MSTPLLSSLLISISLYSIMAVFAMVSPEHWNHRIPVHRWEGESGGLIHEELYIFICKLVTQKAYQVHEIQGLKTEVMLQVPMFEDPRGRNIDDQSQEMVNVLYLGKRVTVLDVFVIFCLFMDSMMSISNSTDRPLLSLSSSFSCSFSRSLLSSDTPSIFLFHLALFLFP